MKDNIIYFRKVVSKNFVADFIASIQNFLGVNLVSYESLIDKAMTQLKEDINKSKQRVKWFRIEITELTNGSLAVLYYGEKQ